MAAAAKDAVQAGNIGARLRSASEIEPSRLPRLKVIAQQWAQLAAEALQALAVGPLTIELVSMSAMTFLKQSKDYGQAGAASVVSSAKWTESGFVLAEPGFIELLIEALFGGEGNGPGPADRPLTDLDRELIQLAFGAFASSADKAFGEIAELSLETAPLIDSDIGEGLAEALPAEKTRYVSVSFEVQTGSSKSTVRYAVPESFVAFNRRKLHAVATVAPALPDEDWRREIQAGLGQADLKLSAILGEKAITLSQVASFTVGQTIVLDETMESLIRIECEDQGLFRGKVGRSRDAYVVRIEEKIDPTQEFIDDILSD